MALYMLMADPHFSDRPPSSCTETYTDDLFDLLNAAAELGKLRGITALVIAGDVFHCKAPSRTSHKLVMRLIEALREFGVEVIIVPGNHDMQHDRIESIGLTQPLGLLEAAGFTVAGTGWNSPHKLYTVPWLQHWTDEAVAQALAPYREMRESGDHSPYLIVTHAPLYPEGQELKWEHYPSRKFADAMGMSGQVFYGHVHEPHGEHGFYDERSGVTFANYGALSRGSLHEYNKTREIGVTFWDDHTGAFEFFPLPAKPAEEVLRFKEAEEATDMQGRLDEFLSRVAATSLESVSTESVLEHVKAQEGVTPAELALVTELLEEASHG